MYGKSLLYGLLHVQQRSVVITAKTDLANSKQSIVKVIKFTLLEIKISDTEND
jgi:hypothetical protein